MWAQNACRWLRSCALALMCAAAPTLVPAVADSASAAESTNADTAELESLVKTLESPQERERLIAEINALIEARRSAADAAPKTPPQPSDLLRQVSARVAKVGNDVLATFAWLGTLPEVRDWAVDEFSDPERLAVWGGAIWRLALVLALAFAGAWIVRRLLARARTGLEMRETDRDVTRLALLVGRTIVDMMPIAAFVGAAYAALGFIEAGEATRRIAIAATHSGAALLFALAIARMVLTPFAPLLRLLALGDEDAAYAYLWFRRITGVVLFTFFAGEAALALGIGAAGYAVVTKLLGLVVLGLVIMLVLQNRSAGQAGFARLGRGEGGTASALAPLWRRIGEVWHIVAILYLLGTYLVWAMEIRDGFFILARGTMMTVLIALLTRYLLIWIARGVGAAFRIRDTLAQRFPALQERSTRYVGLIVRGLQAIVVALAVLAVLQAWGLQGFGWLASESGLAFAAHVVTIMLIVIGTFVLWEVGSILIARRLLRGDGAESARARTLLPLTQSAFTIALAAIAGLMVLAEVGVNIGPLLASAGIAGLAIGFGAQTLVKDIITGSFILAENTVAVGDVAEVAGHAGLVEAINLRTIRLRNLEGIVHTIPYSSVDTVRNFTKEFSYYLFNVGVAYREDLDEVMDVLRALGAEMQADERFGPNILAPLEILGVDAFGDSAIIIKARFKTLPIKQWETGREFNRRMKRRFDELGIEIPFPHQTLYFGENKGGGAPPAIVQLLEGRTASPAEDKK